VFDDFVTKSRIRHRLVFSVALCRTPFRFHEAQQLQVLQLSQIPLRERGLLVLPALRSCCPPSPQRPLRQRPRSPAVHSFPCIQIANRDNGMLFIFPLQAAAELYLYELTRYQSCIVLVQGIACCR
jgi:hypothetical protein